MSPFLAKISIPKGKWGGLKQLETPATCGDKSDD